MPEYTAYVDPAYAEQIMSESLMGEELPGSTQRKGPQSETAPVEEPVAALKTGE